MIARSLQELRDKPRPQPDWIMDGLLKRQNTAVIMGQPKKAAKSWLLLDMCWSLSEGKYPWGIREFAPPQPMRCVYFTQEDTEDDAQDRVLNHFTTNRQPNDRVWIVPKNLNMVLDTTDGRAQIQKALDEVRDNVGGIDLVVFDPMRRMHHGDENDSQTIAKIWSVVDRIHKRYNCATMFSHHIGKPPLDRTNYDPTDPYNGRGSGDIYGGGDAFMVVVPGIGNSDYRDVGVYFESKRGKQPAPAKLKVNFATGQVQYMGQILFATKDVELVVA